ncbi:MAG TPA: hypothetical protein PLX08_10065 [Bacteroidales bacterium]|nr:hypothetical protein [Bacteroidales bacterium]
MSIIGVRDKLLKFIKWAWKYFTYDQQLRLILRTKRTFQNLSFLYFQSGPFQYFYLIFT